MITYKSILWITASLVTFSVSEETDATNQIDPSEFSDFVVDLGPGDQAQAYFDRDEQQWQITPSDWENYLKNLSNSLNVNQKELEESYHKLPLGWVDTQNVDQGHFLNDFVGLLASTELEQSSCPPGFYSNRWGVCQPCGTGCQQCARFLFMTFCSKCFGDTQTNLFGRCFCKSGLERSFDRAYCCQENCNACQSTPDLTKTVCKSCSNGFSVAPDGSSCQCIGEIKPSGTCMVCGGNKYFDGTQCSSCDNIINSDKTKCISCPDGQFLNALDICQKCVGDISNDKKQCTGCTGKYFYDQSQFKCQPCLGTVSIDRKTCTPCTGTNYYDATQFRCVPCQGTVSADKLTCTPCPDGKWFDSSIGACSDCAGTISQNKLTCTLCPANTYFNSNTKTCVDCVGTVSEDRRTCTPCTPGTFLWDSTAKKCQCKGTMSGSNCVPCVAKTFFDLTTMSCQDCVGRVSPNQFICNPCLSTEFWNPTTKECICKGTGSVQSCTPCAVNKYFKVPDYACVNCYGTVSADDLTCTPCETTNICYDEATFLCVNSGTTKFKRNNADNTCGDCPCATCQDTTGACLSCPVAGSQYIKNVAGVESCEQCSVKTPNCVACNLNTGVCTQCEAQYLLTGNPVSCTSCRGVLSGSTCTPCVSGEYYTSNACPACSTKTPNCVTCDLDTGQCDTCSDGYYLDNQFACIACPAALNAAKCSSATVVTECKTTHPKLDSNTGQCVQDCSSTQYTVTKTPPEINTCVDCVSPCLSCSTATNCVACVNGYVLDDVGATTCITEAACLAKGAKFVDSSDKTCKSCNTGCQTCTSTGTCTACQSTATTPYLYFNGATAGQCVQSCSLNTNCLEDTTPKTCRTTAGQVTNCKTCGSNSVCTVCNDGYFLDSSDNSCQPCDSTCLKCINSATKCTVCKTSPAHLFDETQINQGICIPQSDCNDANDKFIDGNTCRTCGTNCDACTSKTACTTCKSNFYADASSAGNCIACTNSDQCLDTSSPSICRTTAASVTNCLTCSTTAVCSVCKSNYYIDGDNPSTFACLSGCDTTTNRFVSNNNPNTCSTCNVACVTCTGSTANHCSGSACAANYVYDGPTTNTNCIHATNACTGAKYVNTANTRCLDCPTGCASCDSSGTCQTCLTNYIFDADTSNCILKTSCTDAQSKYTDSTGPKERCRSCGSGCSTCSAATTGSASKCLTCTDSTHFLDVDAPTTCIATCTASAKCIDQTTSNKVCRNTAGTTDCKYCDSTATCTECTNKATDYYPLLSGSDTICTTVLPANKYYRSSDKSYQDCIGTVAGAAGSKTSCTPCTSATDATNECFDDTASPKVCIGVDSLSTNRLKLTTDICATCNTESNCATCQFGKCASCNSGYGLVAADKTCAACSAMTGCTGCTSSNVCTTCNTIGYYLNSNACVACHSSCKTCTANGCTECIDPLHYVDASNPQQCKATCTGDTVCKDETVALKWCRNTAGTTKCNLCDSSAQCTDCLDNVGVFLSGTTCDSCSSNCNQCDSATVCTSCASTYTLSIANQDGTGAASCVTSCPSNYFLKTGRTSPLPDACLPCSTNCDSCNSETVCTTCNSNFPLENGSDMGKCIANSACENDSAKCKYDAASPPRCIATTGGTTHCGVCASDGACTYCATNYLFQGDTSTCALESSCTTGSYIQTDSTNSNIKRCKTCVSALTNCDECSSATVCTTCASSNMLNDDGSGTINCIGDTTCATTNGKFVATVNSKSVCSNCQDNNCAVCSSATSCTTCKTGYVMDGNVCVSDATCNAKEGFFADTSTKICTACSTGCADCTSATVCTACKTSTTDNTADYVWDGNTSPTSCILKTTCQAQRYLNQAGDTCMNCPNNCETCESALVCKTCNSGSNTILDKTDSQLCIASSECTNGKFTHIASDPDECRRCLTGCKTCTDATDCSECTDQATHYYPVLSSGATVCNQQLPDNKIYDAADKAYEDCIGTVTEVSGLKTQCAACTDAADSANQCFDTSLTPKACVGVDSNSVNRFKDSNGVCATCTSQSNCLTCEFGKCTSCASGFGLAADKTCQACPTGCTTCDVVADPDTCSACNTETHYLNGQQCSAASSTITGCSARDLAGLCTACATNYYIDGDETSFTCLAACDAASQVYVSSTNPPTCKDCHSSCQTCNGNSANQCLTCRTVANNPAANYVWDGTSTSSTTCILEQTCTASRYLNSAADRCLDCPTGCATCSSGSDCNSCSSSFYLDGDSCIDSTACIAKGAYFADLNSNTCTQCSSNCNACSSDTVCTTCNSSFYRVAGTNAGQIVCQSASTIPACITSDTTGALVFDQRLSTPDCASSCSDSYVANTDRICMPP